MGWSAYNGEHDRKSLAGQVLAEYMERAGFFDLARQAREGELKHMADAMLAFASRLTPPAGMTERVEALEAAIQRHRDNIWGGGEVDHPEDVELYAALGRVGT